ncbi:MAG: hypothetical protein JO316_09790 [Abitibacteriaceae bacterium]|nr:hypothetical protein [Abditibacteriaceae bacterium]
MNLVEDWIKQLLTQEVKDLSLKYSYPAHDTAENEIESLIGPDRIQRCPSPIPAPLIEQLHEKLRGLRCEAYIWDALLFHLGTPLPPHVAHDLMDRDIAVSTLGHTRQLDEVQWRLASLVDEALLTLFWALYSDPKYELAELEKLLGQHPDHLWLLDKWQHGWNCGSSSREKELAFHRWVWEHPHRPAEMPNPEQYLHIMEIREHQEKKERLRVEWEQKEEQLRLEREAEERRLEVTHVANDWLQKEKIRFIIAVQEPEMLLALASNPQIPVQWIQKLVNCHHVKGARQIREAAENNIKTRQL